MEEGFWDKSNVSAFSFDDAADTSKILADLAQNLGPDDQYSVHSADQDLIEECDWTGRLLFVGTSSSDRLGAPVVVPTASIPSDKLSSTSSFSLAPSRPTPSFHANDIVEATAQQTVSAEEFFRMEAELKKLRLERTKFEKRLRHERYVASDAEETVERITRGEPYVLEFYKSISDKRKLLTAAVSSGDGDAIVVVLLFLKNTLSSANFRSILLDSPVAAKHYIWFLREERSLQELAELLTFLGRKEELFMLNFAWCCQRKNVEAKIDSLKAQYNGALANDPSLNREQRFVKEYNDLLARHVQIEAADSKRFSSRKQTTGLTVESVLVDKPLLSTLYYCCLYHYNDPMNTFASPLALKKYYQLSERQFLWVAVKALSKQLMWFDIESLLTNKGILGGMKLKVPFPASRLITILASCGAPPEVIAKYIPYVNNDAVRLELAKKHSCHKLVAEYTRT